MAHDNSTLAGRFIVIDGPDGTGKSTQIELLAAHLRGRNVAVTTTRDPGGTTIGEAIRRVLLDRASAAMSIRCEILLYMASRAQLWSEVISPALAAGQCVLCDRWVSSTVAYQVAEGRASGDEVMDIYRLALGDVRPDLTVVLDIDAEVGLARAAARREHDRMEAKGVEFHRKVRALFLRQASENPSRFVVVNGGGEIEQVQARLRRTLESWEWKNK